MSDNYDFLKEYMQKESEERKIREAEAQFRYAERKKEKQKYRRSIESAAANICAVVNSSLEKPDCLPKPEELVALAAALSHAATALHAAENYAESQPYSSGLSLGFCG